LIANLNRPGMEGGVAAVPARVPSPAAGKNQIDREGLSSGPLSGKAEALDLCFLWAVQCVSAQLVWSAGG